MPKELSPKYYSNYEHPTTKHTRAKWIYSQNPYDDSNQLGQLYANGTNNHAYKQVLHLCLNLNKNNTNVQLGYSNFHLRKIGYHQYKESYKVYYRFIHDTASSDTNETEEQIKNQAVTWYTIVKKIKHNNGYDWYIVRSNSANNISTPSSNNTSKHLIYT